MRHDLFTHDDGTNVRTCKVVFDFSSRGEHEDAPWDDTEVIRVELFSSPLWVYLDDIGESVSWWLDLSKHGCESGLYMPAVVYTQAREAFARYGKEMLEYLADHGLPWHTMFAEKYGEDIADMDHLATFVYSLCMEYLATQVADAVDELSLNA